MGEGLHTIRSVMMPRSPAPPSGPDVRNTDGISARVSALREELDRYDEALYRQNEYYESPVPAESSRGRYDSPWTPPDAVKMSPTGASSKKPPFAASPLTPQTREPEPDDLGHRSEYMYADRGPSLRSESLADTWSCQSAGEASPPRPVSVASHTQFSASPSAMRSTRAPSSHLYDLVPQMHAALCYPANYYKFLQCIRHLRKQSEWVDVQSIFSTSYPDFNSGSLIRAVKMTFAYDEIEEIRNVLKTQGITFERTMKEVETFGRSRNKSTKGRSYSGSPVPSQRRYSVTIPKKEDRQEVAPRSPVYIQDAAPRSPAHGQGVAPRSPVHSQPVQNQPRPLSPERQRQDTRTSEPVKGAYVRVQGLRSRDDLNGATGRVLDRRGDKVKVRVRHEEVYLWTANCEVIEPAPVYSAECTPNEAAVVIHNAMHEGPERVIFGVLEDMTPKKWKETQEAFHTIFGHYYGQGLLAALKAEMTVNGYNKCLKILRKNDVYISERDVLSSSVACDKCGHNVNMPFCGSTGERHDPHTRQKSTGAGVLKKHGGTSKALIIACDYRGKGVVALRGRTGHARLMKKCLAKYLKGRCVVLSEDDAGNMPTKKNILKGLEWLVEGVGPEDSLFLYFGGHSCESLDGTGLGIVPCDYGQSGFIDSDELSRICEGLPRGSGLTCVLDCQGGGDVMPMPYEVRCGRGGLPRVMDTPSTPCTTAGEVVVASLEGQGELPPISLLPAFVSVLEQSATPTFYALHTSLLTALSGTLSTPSLSLSWPASLRDERLLLGDVTVR
eukprot:TRINITY_DN19571_c0_g1_i1.p1 TRINITY_DN19571_c0_g1~~TRINITY_DN19571_c0_g1_i1.p1  ORF type:complete len:791 (+),score=187.56 TRINITY_DN19571_c0_g1_i1:27-2375(+)